MKHAHSVVEVAGLLGMTPEATRQLIETAGEGFVLGRTSLVLTRAGAPSEVGPLVAMTRFAMEIVERCRELASAPQLLATALDLALVETSPQSEGDDFLVASGVVRTRSVSLSVRVDGARALSIVSFVARGQRDWTLERANDAFVLCAGDPPEAVHATARASAPSLLGLRCAAETVELTFDGLAPDHDEVADVLAGILDALTPLAPYR